MTPWRGRRVDTAFADVYFTGVGVGVTSGGSRAVMFGRTVVGLVVSGLAAGAIVTLRVWSRSRSAPSRVPPPLLVIPRPVTGVERAIGTAVRPSPAAAPLKGEHVAKPLRTQSPPPRDEHAAVADALSENGHEAPPHAANSETVRFLRPGEEPVQILPGRLEVLAGETKYKEIRFLRIPGEPAELILGREPGVSPQAFTLQSETVSRRHARFAYSNGRWAVTNLSRINPVVVNDERMVDTTVERPLADGDRVELGEVILRFHSR
jgi:pSer/pThr/pTyr-binding forkhead associated (FHA) protein